MEKERVNGGKSENEEGKLKGEGGVRKMEYENGNGKRMG